MRKSRAWSQLWRFLIVGSLTVGVDYLCYHSLLWFNIELNTAKAIGFLAGTLFAYFANKLWTFSGSSHKHGTWWRFPIVYGINLGVNVGLNAYMLELLTEAPSAITWAFLVATGTSATLNFIGMKYFVFSGEVILVEERSS